MMYVFIMVYNDVCIITVYYRVWLKFLFVYDHNSKDSEKYNEMLWNNNLICELG